MKRIISVIVVVMANLIFCSCSFAGINELVNLVESREFWSSYNWGNFEESGLYKSTNWRLSGQSGIGDKKLTDNYNANLQLNNLNVTHMSMQVGYPDKDVREFSIYSTLTQDNEYYLRLVSWCDEKYGNDHVERKYFSGKEKYRHEVVKSYWELENTRVEVTFEKNFSNGVNSEGFFTTLSFSPNSRQKNITVENVANPYSGPVGQATNQGTTGPDDRNRSRQVAGPAPLPNEHRQAVTISRPFRQRSPDEQTKVSRKLGWNSSDRYELNYINDYHEIYDPAEPVVFSVGGKSDKINVDPATGFIVSAIIYETPQKTMMSQVTGNYDPDRGAWLVTIPAPTDNGKTYELFVALTCSTTGSQCAEIYGLGSQVDKLLPLKLR